VSVYREKKNGKWIVDVMFEHADGREERVRKVSPVQTRVGAEQYERQLRASMLDPRPKQKEVPQLSKFIDERWWPTYPKGAGNRHTTVREKEIHLRVHIKPRLGHLRLDEIQGEPVAGLFAAMREAGARSKTVSNVRATLAKLLASAVEWGVLPAMPKLPRVKVEDPPWDFLTSDEAARLLDGARDDSERLLLSFAMSTGCRAGELLALTHSDLNLTAGLVTFRKSASWGVVGPTKSGRERRVPLTATLRGTLAHRMRAPEALVFTRADGSPLKLDDLHTILWRACRVAGLRKIRFHDLRHTFASALVAANVPLRQVQAWLGHSSLRLVERYAHLSPHQHVGLIKAVDFGASGSLTAAAGVPTLN
jgi:integrase